eukprot:TRINITY_DN114_c0_g1_i8.p1 TRINITY_DN114_c0_g1~~TRINITY_DN114_c0_g1_i8.p1  ORF type:complete len:386 (-),score=112.38 TRINITY_DN114_c0_g1_i8:126-1283(-)
MNGGSKIVKVQDLERIRKMEEKLQSEKKEIERKAEEERKKIEQQKNLAEDEKLKLLQSLKEKEEAEKNAKEKQQHMIKKLKKMEEKLLQGDKAKEMAARKEQELQKARLELEEQRIQERRLQEELQKKEEAQLELEKQYKSQQEEADEKSKKFQKLFSKYQEVQQEIKESSDENNREREYLSSQIREIQRELKLKEMIIRYFIPPDFADRMSKRCVWNDESDEWMVDNLATRDKYTAQKPSSSFGLKRPLCEMARVARTIGDFNPRFKYDNIMQLDLDLPERTTEDIQEGLTQKVENTIELALNENDDEMAALNTSKNRPNVFHSEQEIAKYEEDDQNQPVSGGIRPKTGMRKMSAKPRPPSSKGPNPTNEVTNFPKAKGIVTKK